MAPKKKAKNGQNDAVIAAQKKQVDQLRKLVSLHRENARAILQRLQQQRPGATIARLIAAIAVAAAAAAAAPI